MLRELLRYLERVLDDLPILLVEDSVEVVYHVSAECQRNVSSLDTAAVVVEDEVLALAFNIFHLVLEVSVFYLVDNLSTCRLHTWPTASEIVLSTPLIESDSLPSGLVLYIYADCTRVIRKCRNVFLYRLAPYRYDYAGSLTKVCV